MGTIALIFALSPVWEKESLVPSMAFSSADAFDIVSRLDLNGTLDDVPQNKKQKIATGLLIDKLHEQDIAGPLSSRASRVLGPISRHRGADILHHIKLVSCASRPGLTVGFLRIFGNELCTAQRFYTEEFATRVVLDARTNLTLSHTTMSVTGCTTYLLRSGDMLQYVLREVISYMN